jgi:hypothetical protein
MIAGEGSGLPSKSGGVRRILLEALTRSFKKSRTAFRSGEAGALASDAIVDGTGVRAGWPSPGTHSCITDEPPDEVASAGHDRCIIPIKPEYLDAWLQPEERPLSELYAILDGRHRPYYEHRLAACGLRALCIDMPVPASRQLDPGQNCGPKRQLRTGEAVRKSRKSLVPEVGLEPTRF